MRKARKQRSKHLEPAGWAVFGRGGPFGLALWLIAIGSLAIFVVTALTQSRGALAGLASEISHVLVFVAAAGLCGLRALRGVGSPVPWVAFSIALLLQATGWIYFFIDESPPYPSMGDVFWLSYYVAAFAGLLMLLRMRLITEHLSLWADSLIAAATLGAVGAALVVDPLVASSAGDPAAIATALAYPFSDLLVLSLVVAAFALTGWHPGPLWGWVGLAFAIQVLADVIYLREVAAGLYAVGSILDASWLVVGLMLAYAAWRRGADPPRSLRLDGWRVFAPAMAFTLIALGVLVYGTFEPLATSAVVLAVLAMLGSVLRMAAEAHHQRKLSEMARRDPLTGLLNHGEFHREIEHTIETLGADRFSVVIFDVDGFKAVNDDYGHAEGDRVLREIAAALRASARTEDRPGRIGGDEFALLLPGVPEDVACGVAERIRDAVVALDVGIGLSFGVAEWPLHGDDKDMLLLRADMALYEAKPEPADRLRLRGVAEAAAANPDADHIRRLLKLARDQLGMTVAYLSEFTEGEQVFRELEGDAESFGLRAGEGIPLPDTYCQRVVEGRLANVIRDAQTDERVRYLEVTREADLGAYIGVPLHFSDGRLYGTLCCASHTPEPTLTERDIEFMRVIGRLLTDQLERAEHERIERRLETETISLRGLLAALDARDRYTGEHSESVVKLAQKVARQLGLTGDEAREVEQVAFLHDIGKIGMPDSILLKEGPLSESDWTLMRKHPGIGARLVESIAPLAHLAPMVRAEHERWDGTGYPDGLGGEEIPLASRIVFACDSYHAMTSDRPYRAAMSIAAARNELKENAGTQFDPGVVDALLAVVARQGALAPAAR